jgi:hypothetical protein
VSALLSALLRAAPGALAAGLEGQNQASQIRFQRHRQEQQDALARAVMEFNQRNVAEDNARGWASLDQQKKLREDALGQQRDLADQSELDRLGKSGYTDASPQQVGQMLAPTLTSAVLGSASTALAQRPSSPVTRPWQPPAQVKGEGYLGAEPVSESPTFRALAGHLLTRDPQALANDAASKKFQEAYNQRLIAKEMRATPDPMVGLLAKDRVENTAKAAFDKTTQKDQRDVEQYATARKLLEDPKVWGNPQSLGIIFTSNAILQPGGTSAGVRLGNIQMEKQAQPLVARARNLWENMVGEHGQILDPSIAREYVTVMDQIMQVRKAAFEQYAEKERARVARQGLDPDNVITNWYEMLPPAMQPGTMGAGGTRQGGPGSPAPSQETPEQRKARIKALLHQPE